MTTRSASSSMSGNSCVAEMTPNRGSSRSLRHSRPLPAATTRSSLRRSTRPTGSRSSPVTDGQRATSPRWGTGSPIASPLRSCVRFLSSSAVRPPDASSRRSNVASCPAATCCPWVCRRHGSGSTSSCTGSRCRRHQRCRSQCAGTANARRCSGNRPGTRNG